MTLHAKLLGGAFTLAMALASVAAPAMAATSQQNMPNPHRCSIGETYNGGSIANEHNHTHDGDRPSDCDNIGK